MRNPLASRRETVGPREQGARRSFTIVTACVLAAVAAAVASCHVTPQFPRERRLVVRERVPANADGLVVARVPVSRGPLSVVILRAGGGQAGVQLRVSVAGAWLGDVSVPAGATRRADLQAPSPLAPGAVIAVSGEPPGWTLEYLEFANLHGFSSGVFDASVVPRARHDSRRVPAWLPLALVPLLVGLWLVPAARPRSRKWVERPLQAIGVVVFALVLITPLVTRYALVLSLPTFGLCVALIYGGRLLDGFLGCRLSLRRSHPGWTTVLEAALAVALVALFFLAATWHGLAEYGGDYNRFLYMDREFIQAPVLDAHQEVRQAIPVYPSGYDGQYMFLMALDPFLVTLEPARYRQVVDAPAYRYGRIGFSAMTWLGASGVPSAFPRTMVWLIVAAHVLAAVFLAMIAGRVGASSWQVLPYVLVPGFLVSLGRALPESIAAALLLGGFWAFLTSRTRLTIVLWGLSLLVRETGLVLILMVAAFEFRAAGTRRRAAALLLALLPMALWRLYVGVRLAPAFGLRAFWDNPQDFTFPFAGFLRLWSINDAAHGLGQPYNVFFPILLTALLVLSVAMLWVRPGPVAAAAVVYATMAVSLTHDKIWAWVGNGERGTFEAFLLLLVATLPAGGLPRPLQWGLAAFTAALFLYDFHYATYATWFRPALLFFR